MAHKQTKNHNTVTYKTEPVKKGIDLINGTWKFMPGVSRNANGLLVSPVGYDIVEQNGSVSQKNPPVNLAGTHLENVKGNFTVTADIDFQDSNSATIDLYGNTPIIADEFRVERESINILVTKGELFVKVWSGGMQKPIAVKAFPFKNKEAKTLKIVKTEGQIAFVMDNEQVGTINDPGLFKSGDVWFGLDAQDKSWELTSLRVEQQNGGSFTLVDTSSVTVKNKTADSLQQLAQKKRKDFIVGAAMALGPLTSDSQYAQVALNDFNGLTPENDMKMINLQPQRGLFTFQKADALVHIAQQNGLKVHGHTLVFGEANPEWFNVLPVQTAADKLAIKSIMENHIKTVVSHFGTNVSSWDVINEPLADYDAFEKGQIMRNHKWYQAMGEDYIIDALQTAHAANPKALLFINEFGLEDDGERWDAMYALLTKLKPQLEARNIPVNQIGLGFQAHIYERGDKVDPLVLKNHIEMLQQLGYKAQISEQDVYSDDGDKVQSDQYVAVFSACFEEPNCVAWRNWILSDRYDFWKDDDGQIYNGEDGLYDVSMTPRPARVALGRYLTR